MGKRFLALLVVFAIAVTASFTVSASQLSAPDDVKSVIGGAVAYKMNSLGCESISEMLSKLSENAGNYSADWYYIALSQLGENCKNEKSISALKSTVDKFYSEGLDNQKVTDLQRVAFALSACGEDITDVSIRWGVTASAIRELNNLGENDKLKAGQVLRLPADAQQN